ncbi:MAG: L-aspartate oxidase [Candidatus Dormibacteria bacterium]
MSSTALPLEAVDVVVIGSGIAGCIAALTAAPRARVAVVTAGALGDGATSWAQGGIAAALGDDDSAQTHLDDTVAAGRGLCDEAAVRIMVEEAPARIRELADHGTHFDGGISRPSLGREAAHSRARIVHAGGDATGGVIEAALSQRLRRSGAVIHEHTAALALLLSPEGRVAGVLVEPVAGEPRVVGGGAVILATGGAGRLWERTTNPAAATGTGVALAWEAGAEVESLEMVQFHPTAFNSAGARSFLLSEALRGAGAQIIDDTGRRFLFDSDPLGELAGRDVVSLAVWRQALTHRVFLDCRPVGPGVASRFPTVARLCAENGVDITTQPVPIGPAAHYMIGGVRTDVDGATSLPGLYAAGEVASTGVHGANRLASNSLLEAAVFGSRSARRALHDIAELRPPRPAPASGELPSNRAPRPAAADQLGGAMWSGCGLVRDAAGLRSARDTARAVREAAAGASTRLAATTAALVCSAALAREESRGAHLRTDFPYTDPSLQRRQVMQKERNPL